MNALELKQLGEELDCLGERWCADVAYEECIRRFAKEMRYSPDAARQVGVYQRLRAVAKRMLARRRAGSIETKENG